MRRRLLLLVPALVLAVVAGTWYWLLHTQSGARWLFSRIETASDGRVTVGEISGDLGSGLTIRNFELDTGGVDLDVAESLLIVDVDLLPAAVTIESATIRDAELRLSPGREDGASGDLRSILRNLASPVPVHGDDVRIEGFRAIGLVQGRDVVVDRAGIAGRWYDQVRIDRLELTAPALAADLSGSMAFTSPFRTRFTAELNIDGTRSPIDGLSAVTIEADGDLGALAVGLQSASAGAAVEGELRDLLDTPAWNLRATLDEYARTVGDGTTLEFRNVRVVTDGRFGDYRFDASGELTVADLAPATIGLEGTGDTAGLDVKSLTADGPETRLSGSGRFRWGAEWSIVSRLDVERFDPRGLSDGWPADQPLSGKLSLELDRGRVAIAESEIRIGSSGAVASVDAEVDIGESVVRGDLEWRDFRWPLAGEEPVVSSAAGNVSVDGSVDDWRVKGRVTVATRMLPPGEFFIDGRGDRHHVEGEILDSRVLGGRLSGYASYGWRDAQPWSAGLDLTDIEIGTLLQGWPGRASGRVDVSGRRQPFRVDVRMRGVTGELRDGILEGEGRLVIAADTLFAEDLRLRHGETTVALDGDLYSGQGLAFDVAVDEIAKYVGDASGSVAAAGSVSLDDSAPFLRIDARSDSLGYRGVQVNDLVVEDRMTDEAVVAVDVGAARIAIGEQSFAETSASLVAGEERQQLDIAATYREVRFDGRMTGTLDAARSPWRWSGELTELDVALGDDTNFALEAPAALEVSPEILELAPACLATEPATRLCATTSWRAGTSLDIDAGFADVPVRLADLVFDTRLAFDQLLNGNIHWRRQAGGRSTGRGDIVVSAGTIRSDEFSELVIETAPGSLSFDVGDGRLLTGGLQVPMPGFGHVDARFTMHDIAAGPDSAIDGRVDVDLADIALAAAFSPLVDEARGGLRADLRVAGTLGAPELSGTLSLTDGAIEYLPIGLRLDDIDLASTLHEDGNVEIAGTFRAGEGRGRIETRADYAAASGVQFELRGNNLTLIDVSDVHARADVDVGVAYDFRTITLDGRVMVTHARIKPDNLDVTRDTESADVVIVAGELPADTPRRTPGRMTRLAGSLEVVLGDDVEIDLDLATARLSGSTVFTWQNGPIPLADGRYDLTGSVEAFGQVLEITEGGLRFPRIPADNPFIRVRAEREIYGNATVRTAGILVDGTARRPTVEAYTRPATTEERALALLVTGSDFDVEKGVGAVDFGTYIAPRLFVSYGVGLFERENVVRVRYDLTEGFGITATSGQKESGAELNYRLER